MKTFLIVDAHALIHRAYHAMPFLTNKEGVPSGALFGVTNMLMLAIQKFNPDEVIAAFDLPGETFRHAAFAEYKQNRKGTDDALVEQIILAPKIFESFGIECISQKGYEADDVIGTLVCRIQKEFTDYKIIIFTGDMDIMQLADKDKVVIYTGKKGEEDFIFNEKEIFNKYGLTPKQIPDYKGLRGDTSDNIPGIKGIGEKTAMQILNAAQNLENVYKEIESGKEREFFGVTERMYELLKNNKDEAFFSKELATINCDLDFKYKFKPDYKFDENIENIKNICEEYNFLSIKKKLDRKSYDAGEIEFAEVPASPPSPLSEGEGEPVQKLFNDQIDFSPENLKKAQIALWLLNSAENNADSTRLQYLTKKNSEKDILEYLEAEIRKNDLQDIYFEMELKLIPILKEANEVGIRVDREELQKLLKRYEKTLEELTENIYLLSGREFNINSPKQLGEVLFSEMKIGDSDGELRKVKKTKTGKVSTNFEVLDTLREAHPIIPKILDYREKEKMVNTYLEPLLEYSTFDERIHTTFLQTGAATGRFASTNPNMQNIPVKGEEGKALRKCFIASPGKVLLAADYSQIELRIAGMLSGDEYLKEIYKSMSDVHTMIAVKMFRKTEADITKDERNAAKAMNFGILYGMGVSSIKNSLKVERNIAQAFYDSYTMSLTGLMKYLKDTVQKAKEVGYTETLYGRKRQIKELFSNIPFIRASGERMALNAPIQGTNADIIKLAMVDFYEVCKKKKWVDATVVGNKINFLLQIHDEVLFEVDKDLKKEVEYELKKCMESVIENHKPKIPFTPIPLLVNIKSGPNWGEM